MIQRIQSIFLALAGGGLLGLFGLPFASTTEKVATSDIFANDTVYNLNDHIALLILFALSAALSIASIFLYNNRKNQMLLTKIALAATVVGLIAVAVFMMKDWETLEKITPSLGLGAYLPIVSIVLLGLAHRYINKDEKMVRSSYDRLR